ncbi:MAG TPA: beta-N-acetylhexosaminidase [Chitinophagaceae bacterium]|nr:beta-N-acetylhexosaminidase [Chitinophagaceae bacterium]
MTTRSLHFLNLTGHLDHLAKHLAWLFLGALFISGFPSTVLGQSQSQPLKSASAGHSPQRPSLIPLPQQLKWTGAYFPPGKCKAIIAEDPSLMKVAADLQNILEKKGIKAAIRQQPAGTHPPVIELKLGNLKVPLHPEEAYRINVTENKVSITANTPHGIFNGIQTLRQLMVTDVAHPTVIAGCHITDWPAFTWRGYMVDVGRNFQTVDHIKQQIDVMARYKLNVFHFHLTENVAWRLQIKRYPQLTDPQFMTRNKGQYYTIYEMKQLINYCNDRFITLVPEIDMPGHSAAFERAMGFDMQSEKGLAAIKNILSEIDSTYDVPYIHIGADEVKFTNKDFIPEVVQLIHRQGKRTIGWNPGGNYDPTTIRQLWASGSPDDPHGRYIDSRSLYLNHKDPLSGVPYIFDRKIGQREQGDSAMLGGEICLWNDDRAKNEKDILLMNFAYPAMLAFAERSWRGGGFDGSRATLGADTSVRYQAFAGFEKRLLDQKSRFFKAMPFPYVKQTGIHWQLFGPFNNHGDTAARFWPEIKPRSITDSTAVLQANGATIWLRHFFPTTIAGILKDPKPHTTWYAFRKIYSPADTPGYFWISFYNPSRSHGISTPPLGQWDFRGSNLWINGKLVDPPRWTYPGRSGSQENPLVDESYEYRPPTRIPLKKGWNTILVKAPVGSFKGSGWQHPVKWMFTVVRVSKDASAGD